MNLRRTAAADDADKPAYLRTIAIAVGCVGLIAAAIYISAEAWWRPAPEGTDLARTIRERHAGKQQPQVVYVPVPITAQSSPMAASSPTPVPSPTSEALLPAQPVEEPPLSTLAVNVVQPPPAPTPEPMPLETETDIRRKQGLIDFERAMVALSAKADQADIAWQRYLAGCRENITTATASTAAVAGVASRDWIAIVGAAATSSVTTRTWTEACAEAGAFFSLASQVSQGMCVAEDAARRASVYPGSRRDFRTKYRLDWSGWDAYCR